MERAKMRGTSTTQVLGAIEVIVELQTERVTNQESNIPTVRRFAVRSNIARRVVMALLAVTTVLTLFGSIAIGTGNAAFGTAIQLPQGFIPSNETEVWFCASVLPAVEPSSAPWMCL